MSTPAWIQNIRSRIGHDSIMAITVCGVILNDKQEILLQRRSDTHTWSLPGGFLELEEHLTDALQREVKEETGATIAIERLSGLYSGGSAFIYPNGDRVSSVRIAFVCRYLGGRLGGTDGESTEVRFFAFETLPENLTQGHMERIQDALNGDAPVIR